MARALSIVPTEEPAVVGSDLDAALRQARRVHDELARLEAAIRGLPRFDPQTSKAQRRCCVLMVCSARLRQSAIARAIALYRIAAPRVHARVAYSASGDMRDRDSATYVDHDGSIRVEIGEGAFASAGRLGSTIAHEVEVHLNRHLGRGVYYPPIDERTALIQELEAYDYELANRDRFGLAASELQLLQRRRASCHRSLERLGKR